jgi:N-acylglucosamine-6-phosphate 2-epimerase
VEKMNNETLHGLRRGLVVSCQAPSGSPLNDPEILSRIAVAAEDAGAIAIRAEGLANVEAIRRSVKIPIIGLIKRANTSEIYITPEISDVVALANAGSNIIALDATSRLREGGLSSPEFIERAIEAVDGLPIMADVDDVASAIAAEKAGAAFVGTTLSGYTKGEVPSGPDVELVRDLSAVLSIPIIAEGRYSNLLEAQQALDGGAYAVCIGTSLTDPWTMVTRLVAGLK